MNINSLEQALNCIHEPLVTNKEDKFYLNSVYKDIIYIRKHILPAFQHIKSCFVYSDIDADFFDENEYKELFYEYFEHILTLYPGIRDYIPKILSQIIKLDIEDCKNLFPICKTNLLDVSSMNLYKNNIKIQSLDLNPCFDDTGIDKILCCTVLWCRLLFEVEHMVPTKTYTLLLNSYKLYYV